MPTAARSARAIYAAEIATSSFDDIGDIITYGVERGWCSEITAAVKRDPGIAPAAILSLPPRHRAALYRWAATPAASDDAAGHIAVAALHVDAPDMAARILSSHLAIADDSNLIDALSEQVRNGNHAAAIISCRAGVSPFPLTVSDPTYVAPEYLDAQRSWIIQLLADRRPSLAARRRRLLLPWQAAAEAGVVVDHHGDPSIGQPHLVAIKPSLHRAASAPHMGGLLVDHEPLTWLAGVAIRSGITTRDAAFAAELMRVAAAHGALTHHMDVFATMGAAMHPTV